MSLGNDNDCCISKSVTPAAIAHLANNIDHYLNGKGTEDNTESFQIRKECNNIIGPKQCFANFFLYTCTQQYMYCIVSYYMYMHVNVNVHVNVY